MVPPRRTEEKANDFRSPADPPSTGSIVCRGGSPDQTEELEEGFRSPQCGGRFPLYRAKAMTAEDFTAWMEHQGLNVAQTARTLELSRNTVAKYQREGAPLSIALACAAVSFGLPPWKKPDN